jgi:hypothetical protein
MSSISEIWGTTPDERRHPYPCDDIISQPDAALYRGITVNASPETLFRWLCQLRVAPYSYDWIDNGGWSSPQELTPGVDDLVIGENVLRFFRLTAFVIDRHLSLRLKRGSTASRMFGDLAVSYLVADDHGHPGCCRLLVKLVITYPRGVYGVIVRRILPWGDLIMMRRQLLNLKRLAEAAQNQATANSIPHDEK